MLDMNGKRIKTELNVLHLGSYELLIGMDWLECHRAIINFLDKTFTCIDDEGRDKIVKGIPRPIRVR